MYPNRGDKYSFVYLFPTEICCTFVVCGWKAMYTSSILRCSVLMQPIDHRYALSSSLSYCTSSGFTLSKSSPDRSARVSPRFTTTTCFPASAARFTRRKAEYTCARGVCGSHQDIGSLQQSSMSQYKHKRGEGATKHIILFDIFVYSGEEIIQRH